MSVIPGPQSSRARAEDRLVYWMCVEFVARHIMVAMVLRKNLRIQEMNDGVITPNTQSDVLVVETAIRVCSIGSHFAALLYTWRRNS